MRLYRQRSDGWRFVRDTGRPWYGCSEGHRRLLFPSLKKLRQHKALCQRQKEKAS
jgi:hypothetical protein